MQYKNPYEDLYTVLYQLLNNKHQLLVSHRHSVD